MKNIIIIAAAVFIAGCSPKPAEEQAAIATPTASDERLARFFNTFEALDRYQIDIIHVAGSQTDTYQVQFQAPDTTRTVATLNGRTTQIVYAGNDTYMKSEEDGVWYKLPLDKFDQAKKYSDLDIRSFGGQNSLQDSQLEYQGETPCGDLTCFQYSRTHSDGSRTTMLFDTAEYFLRQVTIKEKDASTTLNYAYDEVGVTIPAIYEEVEIPENPTQQDILKLQKIYGTEE